MFKNCAPKPVNALTSFLSSNGFTGTVNEVNVHGIMPLQAALLLSNSGNPQQGLVFLKELLALGANPLLESTDHLKINSAGLAAAHGLTAEFKEIIEKCPDAATDLSGAGTRMSPFAFAILNFTRHPEKSSGFMDEFKGLVDMKQNLPGQDVPPMIFAAINDQVEAIEYFIKSGADLTVGQNAGWNAAHWAAAFGCFKSFAAICALKPELAVSFTGDNNQWNPLTVAAVHAKLRPEACKSFIKQLHDQEYNIDMYNGALDTPLMISAWSGQSLPGVQDLLECGADPDLKYTPLVANHPNAGKTAFILATGLKFEGEPQAVMESETTRSKILVELVKSPKFHIEANSYNGFTAFSWAMETNSTEVLDAIEAKAHQDLGSHDSTGQTYLQWAVGSPKYSWGVTQWLVGHGSDVNIVYNKMAQVPAGLVNTGTQRTAFTDICEQFSVNTEMTHDEVQTQLAKARYIMNSPTFSAKFSGNDADGDGFNVIHWAISLKDARIVHDLCMKYSTLVSGQDKGGSTPLKWTANYYNAASATDKVLWKNVAAELVSHGASPEDLSGTDLLFDALSEHAQLHQSYAAQDAVALSVMIGMVSMFAAHHHDA